MNSGAAMSDRLKTILVSLSLLLNLVLGVVAARYFQRPGAGTEYGSFINAPPKVVLGENGRDIELLDDFGYIDRRNTIWTAPKGYVSNGASIPPALWSLVGGPLDGRYRNAAIIHDKACDERTRPAEDVHLAFYEACRCAGLGDFHAKVLYAGILVGGPRWQLVAEQVTKSETVTSFVPRQETREVVDPVTGETKTVTTTVRVPMMENRARTVTVMVPEDTPNPPLGQDDVEAIRRYIESENPSAGQIDQWVRSRAGAQAEPPREK
jgi:hypothetical protein